MVAAHEFASLTDDQLIQQVQAGRSKAFGELVQRYLRFCQAYFFRKVFDKEAARDLSQEAFISAFNAIQRFEPGSNFKGWLMTICRNKFLDYLRSVRRRETPVEHVEAHTPGIENTILRSTTIAEGLKLLDPLQQEVVAMKYMGDMSCQEIAKALEIPEGTVKSFLFGARKRLYEYFQGKEVEG
ncbi:MAG: RNA polymerase sigma factor [Candidatus Riflebacteria bacterium]|nr:RNA polymerase sigma factor [Candidatus Riflebacteria bacterium]